MGLGSSSPHMSPGEASIYQYRIEDIPELFKTSRTERLYWPWQWAYRESIIANSASAARQARNMNAFMSLFPSIGSVLEEQASVARTLSLCSEMGMGIYTSMKNRQYPLNWAKVGELSMDLLTVVDHATTQGTAVLQRNNFPVIEQGARRMEFDAMRRFVERRSYASLPEQLKDGELYMRTIIHGNKTKHEQTLRLWRDIITIHLKREYGGNGAAWQKAHLEAVNTLPTGAAYAYIWVLLLAEQADIDPRKRIYRATNPHDWLENKEIEYEEQLKTAKMRVQK